MEEAARSTTERARIVSARQSCSSDACAHGGGWSELREEANAARAGWRARHGLCAPCSDEWVEGQVQKQAATRRFCARYAAHDSAAAAAPRSAFRARCGWPGRILSSAGRDLEVWALGRAWPGHTEHLAALALGQGPGRVGVQCTARRRTIPPYMRQTPALALEPIPPCPAGLPGRGGATTTRRPPRLALGASPQAIRRKPPTY